MQDILKEQLSRIIRYAYPGFLTLLFMSFVATDELKALQGTIGVALTAVCAVVVGAAIYVGYRLVLGELVIFPIVNAIHTFISKHTRLTVGVTGWLGSRFSVGLGSRRAAYGYLRSKCSDKSEARHLDFIHTELHILYLSAIITIGFSIFQSISNSSHSIPLGITGCVILFAACMADIRAHIRQKIYFERVEGSESVRKLLAEGGFVDAGCEGTGDTGEAV